MSILTDLLEHKISFSQAAEAAVQWARTLVAHDASLTAAAEAVLSDVKQAASNAVDLADTAIGSAIVPGAKAVETALDAALARLTGGLSIPFNGFVDDGVDRLAAVIKAEADAWALKVKANLAAATAKPTS